MQVNINLSPPKIVQCIEKFGIGFCFAQNFHPAMKIIKDIRKNLGSPTFFNILGPLLNPAKAKYLLVGVFNHELMTLMAEVVLKIGIKKAMVFHGNGLDELSCIGCTNVLEVTTSGIKQLTLDPEVFGFTKCTVDNLRGGNSKENAEALLDVFKGKTGPVADTIIFNAAVALYIYGITASVEQAIQMVKNSISDGKALELINNFVAFSQAGESHG